MAYIFEIGEYDVCVCVCVCVCEVTTAPLNNNTVLLKTNIINLIC